MYIQLPSVQLFRCDQSISITIIIRYVTHHGYTHYDFQYRYNIYLLPTQQ